MFYKNGSPEHLRGPFLRGKNLSKRLLSEIAAVYGVLRKFNTSILSKNEAKQRHERPKSLRWSGLQVRPTRCQ